MPATPHFSGFAGLLPFTAPSYYWPVFKTAKMLAVWWLASCSTCGGAAPCESLQGAEQLRPRPGLRCIIVGETHGTTETPAIFADLICAAREDKRPIIVGIELHDQSARK